MSKTTIEAMQRRVKGLAAAVCRRLRTPRAKVKRSRSFLSIWTPTGGLHVLPALGAQPVSFKVEKQPEEVALKAFIGERAPASVITIATFSTNEDANKVLAQVTRAVNASHFVKWSTRAVVLGFAYLFTVSYLEVMEQQQAVQAAPAATMIPTEEPQYQDLPSPMTPPSATLTPQTTGPAHTELLPSTDPNALASFFLDRAMEAGERVEASRREPEKLTPDSGLADFGLNASSEMPGCDPAMAFKVPD